MPSSGVRTFLDPDDYTAAIRGAQAEVTVTGRGEFTAKLARNDLHRLWMHRFSDNPAAAPDPWGAPRFGCMPLWGRPAMISRLSVFAALIAVSPLAAGCSAPNPNTAAGQSEIAGQQCTVCRVQNPGDIGACYAVCMQRIEDQGTYLKSNGH